VDPTVHGTWTLTAHHASPLMDVLDPFKTSLFYYRARRDFGYRDFATREDKVSCPLVSRVPKRRSVDQQHVSLRWTVQVLPWIMGSTVPISSFLARVKRGHGINACVSSSNLTVITDLGSSERITFVHCFARADRVTDLGSSERISPLIET
jgi:hypothetical protein